MAVRPSDMIDKGSHWETIDKTFVVEDVKINDEGTWIYYKNIDTGEQYNCLVDAFLSKFIQNTQ
jgi:hypothetical protein